MSTAYGQLQEEKDGTYTIKIKELSGKTHDFSVNQDGSVGELKKTIEAKLNHPANRQRLIWQGREFRDDASKFREIFKGQESRSVVVHLVVRPAGSTNAPPPSTQSTQQAYRHQQAAMQTVNCPFCRTMVQFPVGSRMIRCSSCGGISRIQVAQVENNPSICAAHQQVNGCGFRTFKNHAPRLLVGSPLRTRLTCSMFGAKMLSMWQHSVDSFHV
uniref:Ubiquitin-like domain-containing protein n=1 Tax=Lotharella globosa TaxID=91324 RepID=A0A7S3ZIG1_9EUKA